MIKILLALLLALPLLLVSCGGRGYITYEEFWAMSGDEQLEYKESFESTEAFYDWYNAAREEHFAANYGTSADDGEINLDELNKQYSKN